MAKDPDSTDARKYGVSAGVSIDIPGVDNTAKQIANLTKQVEGLQKALTNLSTSSSAIGSNISGMLNKVSSAAGSGSGSPPSGGSGGGGYLNGGVANIAKSMFGTVNANGWVRDLALFPQRFMTDQIAANRDLATGMSSGLGMQAFASGTGTPQMMNALAGNFGNVLGSPQDLLSMAQIAGRAGAGLDWRNYAGGYSQGPSSPGAGVGAANMPRAAGFYRGVFEAQRMNPGAPVEQLAGTIGGYSANVGAQQAGTFMTGGAFSMIKRGNQQKSISEWATGILKFLQSMRPGNKRGQAFSYGELMTQNFPGSNVDVWLTVNGVPDNMKDYFWTYAMAQSRAGTEDIFGQEYLPTQTNISFRRLQAGNAQTRSGLQLAGQLSGTYSNKEQSNRWMNELLGSMLNTILPQAMSSKALSYMQYLPDMMQEILQQLSERTTIGALGGAMTGWGSLFEGVFEGDAASGALGGITGALPPWLQKLIDGGDVGDVGDYGPMGATSTAGMHPDARKRVDAMMRANPRLRMNSGFRDLGTQQRLKRKGVGRVSGKPSAHTRGMAADLGPRSEYPWIVANAKKFGLKSGISAGEPWHVGMGDVEGVGDSGPIGALMGIFSQWGSLFDSNDPTAQISGVAGGTSAIFKMLMAMFGGGETNSTQLQPRDVYGQLTKVTQEALRKGLVFPDLELPTAPGGGGGVPGAPTGPAGAKSLDAFFTAVLKDMGMPATRNNLIKLAAVAKVEGNQSGTFNPFNSTGGPGSNFNTAGVKNYPDWATGVEWTANQLEKKVTSLPGGPEMAVVRGNLSSDGTYGNFQQTMADFYRSWQGHHGANLLTGISSSRASEMLTHDINAGDVDDYYTSGPMSMASPRSAPMVFQNSFTIQGGAGGNNGGIDVRRTATQIADQLETQMRQRMSRSN